MTASSKERTRRYDRDGDETGLTMNRGGWSWKRQLGITKAKRRVSRATGVPWSKSGRQRKVGGIFWKLFK